MFCKYSIPVNGLKEGHYLYEFNIDKFFFELFEESEIREGNLRVSVDVEKKPSYMNVVVTMKGTVVVTCDRCLEEFDYPIDCENRLIVGKGSELEEDNTDIILISEEEKELDLSHYFYESIILALPIQRIHFDDEEGRSTCNPLMLKKIEEHLGSNNNKEVDPRWEKLRDITNN